MAGDDSPEKPVGDPEGEGKLPPKSETLSASLFKRLSTPIQFGKPKTPSTEQPPEPEQPESSLDPQWRESFERVRQCNDPVSRELAMRAEIKNFPEFKLSEYRKLYELWDKKPSAFDRIFPARKWITNTPFWKWTGIGEKKGWDILQLLIAPVLVAAIGFGLQRYFTEKDAAQQKAEQQRSQLIADEKAKQETLVKYLDQMATSLNQNLLQAKPGDKEFIIAQARTVIALQSLDSKRQHLVIQYLQAAGLNQARTVRVDKDGKTQFGKGDKVLLYQAQMEKANLKESDLSGAVLIRANLSSADLSSANLFNANLSSADLSSANLFNANLSFANLSSADLSSANLSSADLSAAYLRSADLSSANLRSADLSSANLRNAIFRSSDFLNIDLSNADLSNADLSNTNLISAKLSNAKLSNADLSNASLFNIDLSNAKLFNVILLATNLSSARGLTQEQLEGEEPPLLCKVTLPKAIKIDPNRDCQKLPRLLLERYSSDSLTLYPDDFDAFKTLEEAQNYVDKISQP